MKAKIQAFNAANYDLDWCKNICTVFFSFLLAHMQCSGSVFKGLLDPDSESGSRGLKKVKNEKY